MNIHPQKRQLYSPRFTRNSKDDLNYTFHQDQSKWRKKAWTQEEDQFLTKLVAKHGPQKWTLIAQSLPGRVGKQCRERWHNHLNPEINKNEWNQKQQWILFLLHRNMGNQWAQFTKHLPGRTDNSIKNHWNSIMKKRASQYNERFKKIKHSLQATKEAGDQEIDLYLLQKITNQISFSISDAVERKDQKIKTQQDAIVKSMGTVTKKRSVDSFMDLEQTAKKKAREQNHQKCQENTVKNKKGNQFNFSANIASRLSQLSLFGPQSIPNNVSAFSLLQQGQPPILQPQLSFNDFSLSIHCFEQQKQQSQSPKQSKQDVRDSNPTKIPSRQFSHVLRTEEMDGTQ